MAALSAGHGADTLFVFFNKVYKVLDAPFERPALLLARSSAAGANIVYRREVDAVLGYFGGEAFLGLVNLRVASGESFSPRGDFGPRPVGYLDLAGYFDGFYDPAFVPSSGFALAVWLVEQLPDATIVLAGFTGQRGAKWKIFRDHDWTFEQIVQRLLAKEGRLSEARKGAGQTAAIERIARRFPQVEPVALVSVASDVLAQRLDQSDGAMDELIVLTRPQRRLRGLLARLKPRTRKQRLAARGEA
ncbi:hypothetical protein ASG48_12445 [Aurantimonas sp. Leaf443]|nr:hypothetical protein ASG48_12445 [Aurantimonas sp. Leaf443]